MKYGFKRLFSRMYIQGFNAEASTGDVDVTRRPLSFQSEIAIKKVNLQSVDYQEALAGDRRSTSACGPL
jgi:hypothetical protein